MCTRPDIALAVHHQLQQVAENPVRDHWDALEHLWGYVVHTAHLCLRPRPTAGAPMLAFRDSSHAGAEERRDGRATSVWLGRICVWLPGGLESWQAGRGQGRPGGRAGDSESVVRRSRSGDPSGCASA